MQEGQQEKAQLEQWLRESDRQLRQLEGEKRKLARELEECERQQGRLAQSLCLKLVVALLGDDRRSGGTVAATAGGMAGAVSAIAM